MNVLVGDTGSTKSAWWLGGTGIPTKEIRLAGYNPVTQDEAAGRGLLNALREACAPFVIDAIYYYGAGVLNAEKRSTVYALITETFPGSRAHVASDLEGAALAACEDRPGALAILGTGSHAAVYDGKHIIRQAASLGYILGDEGGGCDIGKCLVQAYFYGEMPLHIRETISGYLMGGRAEVLQQLHTSPAPNQYLAGFAQVAVSHIDDLWIQELVSGRFRLFIMRHLIPLSPEVPIHVVGSIGSIFAGLLKKELEKTGLVAGLFIRDPGYRLFEIHFQHGKQKS